MTIEQYIEISDTLETEKNEWINAKLEKLKIIIIITWCKAASSGFFIIQCNA